MNMALAIEEILPAAEYFGCTDANTQEQYEKEVVWYDKRIPKPKWEQILEAWDQIKDVVIDDRTDIERKIVELESRIETLEGLIKIQAELIKSLRE